MFLAEMAIETQRLARTAMTETITTETVVQRHARLRHTGPVQMYLILQLIKDSVNVLIHRFAGMER